MSGASALPSPGRMAIVSPYFWPERLGCAPYVTDLALELSRRGHGVHVFTADPHYPRKSGFRQPWSPLGGCGELSFNRARVLDRSSGRTSTRIANDLLFASQTAIAVARRKRGIDAVLALAPSVLGVAAVRLAGFRGRLVAAVYDIECGLARATGHARASWSTSVLETVEAWCLNHADAVIVLTDAMRETLLRIGVRAPIEVVPLWSLASLPDATVRRRAELPGTIMYSGGLSARHGIDLLPPFWAALAGTGIGLIVQGDGAERDRIHARLRAIGGPLELRDPVSLERLPATLAEADLQLVLQTPDATGASMPSKAISAAAAGLPFVTNAAASSPLAAFAVRSGAGLVVPDADAGALAAAAAAVLADPDRLARMARSGPHFVRENHARAPIVERYLHLLLAGHGARSQAQADRGSSLPRPEAEAA